MEFLEHLAREEKLKITVIFREIHVLDDLVEEDADKGLIPLVPFGYIDKQVLFQAKRFSRSCFWRSRHARRAPVSFL
jgi:hypothetical protein